MLADPRISACSNSDSWDASSSSRWHRQIGSPGRALKILQIGPILLHLPLGACRQIAVRGLRENAVAEQILVVL